MRTLERVRTWVPGLGWALVQGLFLYVSCGCEGTYVGVLVGVQKWMESGSSCTPNRVETWNSSDLLVLFPSFLVRWWSRSDGSHVTLSPMSIQFPVSDEVRCEVQ
jgi:hypothetical protein